MIAAERMKNLSELRRLVKVKRASLDKIAKFLILKGVNRSIAQDIALFCMQGGEGMKRLPQAIEKHMCISRECTLKEKKAGIHVFVGPSERANQQLIEQVKQYAFSCGATDLAEHSLFQPLEKKKLSLIHTPHCLFFDEALLEKIGRELAKIEFSHVHLVLPAYLKEADMYAWIHQFSSLPLTYLAFTHLDQTLTLGTLLNVSKRSEIPVHFFSQAQEVYESTCAPYTKALLTKMNEKEFQLIRRIAFQEKSDD